MSSNINENYRRMIEDRALVNIGLDVGDKKNAITPRKAIAALKKVGVHIIEYANKQSATESTLIAQLSRLLTPAEAYAVSVALQQEAIAQIDSYGKGELYGPKAENWKPFNPAFFLNLNKPILKL